MPRPSHQRPCARRRSGYPNAMACRYFMPMLLGLLASGCAAHSVVVPASSERAEPCEQSSAVAGGERVGLYDLTWKMQTGEHGPTAWSPVPDALHAFPVGPWECALGPQQAADSFRQERGSLQRERRLACTHKSGATVQTELRCAAELPLAEAAVESVRRELALTLSTAPSVYIACVAEPRQRLEAAPDSKLPHAPMCLTGARIHACESAAAPLASTAR